MKQIIKLTLLLLALLLPATASAYSFKVNGIYYNITSSSNRTVQVTYQSYTNGTYVSDYSGNVTIPSTVTYGGTTYAVTEIGYAAFYKCSSLTSVSIPNSVNSIDSGAFYGCSGLTSVTIPSSVTYIGNNAFSGCSGLTSVIISDLVAWLNISFGSVFANPLSYAHRLYLNDVEMKDLVIPNTVTSIKDYAFEGCSGLISVTIPSSVTSIAYAAFGSCSGLTSITIGSSVISIGDNAFTECSGLTSVTIPNSVTTIGNDAFEYCSGLTSVTMGNSISSIGSRAFFSCSRLKTIIWNAVNCTSIGEDAFTSYSSYSINTLQFGNGVEHIPAGMPSLSMSGKKLVLPNSVKTIEEGAFTGSCAAVVIGNGIENIATGAFPSGISVAYAPTTTPQPCEANAFANPQTLYVPAGSRMSYFTSQGWGEFANIVEGTYVRAASVTLNKYSTTMTKGNTLQLTATISPSNASTSSATWLSTNPAVATVSSNGKITAVAVGETDIVAMVDNVRATCHVTVTPMLVQSLTLSDTQLTLEPDGMYTLTATVSPTNADNQTLEWIIPNNNVIVTQVVNNTRLNIGAVGTGSVTVTARTTDGSNLSANCTVTVQVNASSIALNMSSAEMTEGGVLQLVATVLPTNATNRTVTWKSSNTSVATVNSGGLVTAVAPGTATITATTTDGTNLSATCSLLVKQSVIYATSISLNKTSATITEGNTTQLTATVLPTNATNRTVTWSTSNSSVATVNSNGLVTAINSGSVTITATTADGTNLSATCAVTVQPSVIYATSISLNKTSASITEGNTLQLSATVLPTNATNRTVTWKSSKTSVATVNSNGLVTAKSPGSATITATTADGTNLSATCAVTVQQNVIYATSITLNKTSAELTEGENLQLTATVLPTNATNRSVTWKSSNTSVATVNSNGLVTAQSSGSASITATTTDGTNLSATCAVTVNAQTSSNYFAIPDTTVQHGEIVVIPVRLNNEDEILSFQTDLFLPEDFNLVVDEDDEYMVTPSGRLSSDHILMTQDVSNGAVRLLCYAPNGTPFMGNEGDLFYLHIQVPDNAGGDYTLSLSNTLLTTSDYNELSIPDAEAVLTVNTFIPGDVNDSHTVTVTDIVVTAQYIMELNPSPFIFAAADMNEDENISVTDIALIAYVVNHPTMNALHRMPALTAGGDRMSGEGITLMAGETRTVSITLDNAMDYSAFQLDLMLPEGLTASNFQLTDRAGSHALDVNALANGKTRVLCYSPAIAAIEGHSGALLTFEVTANAAVDAQIAVDGIELVTTDCRTVLLNDFAIGVNNATGVNVLDGSKTVSRVDYYNLAGQRVERPESGVTLKVTTYTDGTRTTTKIFQ